MEGSISQQAPSASSMANRCRKMQQYQLIRSKRKTISVSFDQNIRLIVREERTRAKIKRFENRLLLWVPYEADYDYRQKQLEKWYRKEAFSVISRKAAEYAKMLGVSFEEIHIKDQKSRWGSCSGMKNLNFNWYHYGTGGSLRLCNYS